MREVPLPPVTRLGSRGRDATILKLDPLGGLGGEWGQPLRRSKQGLGVIALTSGHGLINFTSGLAREQLWRAVGRGDITCTVGFRSAPLVGALERFMENEKYSLLNSLLV